jgi:hypothetical protein
LLKELLQSGKEIAEQADDNVQLSYYIQLEKQLTRHNFANFKNHQMECLWYLADTGKILADTAKENAGENEIALKKAEKISAAYDEIKTHIQEVIIANSPRKL